MTPGAPGGGGSSTALIRPARPARPGGQGLPELLVIEPDEVIAADVAALTQALGISSLRCQDGAQALLALGTMHADAVLMAAHLPVLASDVVIRVLREHRHLPILVGAGPGDERAAQAALRAGASAVVARPYDKDAFDVLGLARAPLSAGPQDGILRAGPITVDTSCYEVHVGGREVVLSRRELEVLVYLLQQHGRVASEAEISQSVWGRPMATNTVAVHITRLRSKLGEDREHGQMIRNVRGVGYRLTPSLDQAHPQDGNRAGAGEALSTPGLVRATTPHPPPPGRRPPTAR